MYDIFYSCLSVHLHAYADDITMLVTGAAVVELSICGNKFLEYLSQWCNKNCLNINNNKTRNGIFLTQNKTPCDNIQLVLGNDRIEIGRNVKCSGIAFFETLNWDMQIDSVRASVNVNDVLSRRRCNFPRRVKLLIHNAFMLPVISYCHTIWGTTKPDKLKLVVAQKRAI